MPPAARANALKANRRQIVVQPQSQSVPTGGNVTFAVEATGTEPLSLPVVAQ